MICSPDSDRSPKPGSAAGRYRLVVFDMDGTLTEELLDFPAIRREIGVPEKAGILEFMAGLEPTALARAREILHRHEMEAAGRCVLHPGAAEVLAELRARGVATALLTRNSPACAEAVLARHGLSLDHVATREDLPHKPHADSILNLCRRFGILPEQTLMVGDYLYDVQAARNAGVDCALVCFKPDLPPFAGEARYCVRSLPAIVDLVFGNEK